MPIVVLEAISTGVLCVCPNVGSIPEVVTHGETGFMFDPMDTKGMVGTILEAFHDKDLRQKICIKAKEFVATDHNPEQIVRMYLDIFEKVLEPPVATP